jgi:Mg2+ and Co2+ transporter CorA
LTLHQSVKALVKGIENIKQELSEIENDSTGTQDNDWFRDVMSSFIVSSEVRLHDLLYNVDQVEKDLKDMLEYFGEDLEKRSAPPEDFFRVLWDFQISLQVISYLLFKLL